MYELCSKLVCLSKLVKGTDNRKTLAYYRVDQFSVDYKSVMLYNTGPGSCTDHRDRTRVQMSAKMFPHLRIIMFAVYGPHSWF